MHLMGIKPATHRSASQIFAGGWGHPPVVPATGRCPTDRNTMVFVGDKWCRCIRYRFVPL